MAGVFLFNNDVELISSIGENNLIENYQESELGGSINGYCTMPFNLYQENSKYFGLKADDNFYLYRIVKTVRQKNIISLIGVHIFFDELNTRTIKDIRPANKPISYFVAQILQNTDWKVGLSDIDVLKSKNFYYQSCLSAFYETVKLFNCEFKLNIKFNNGKIVSKTVDLLKEVRTDLGKWFEVGDKLVSVEAESNDGEIYTSFIGRGKGLEITDENGQATGGYSRKITFADIVWAKPNKPINKPKGDENLVFEDMVNIFGFRETVIDFDDIEDKEELLQRTYEYGLEHSRPRMQLKASAIGENVSLGEVCTVVNDRLNIRYKTRVFKLKTDHLANDRIEFEFGDKIKTSVAERFSAQSNELEKSKQSIEKGLESFKRQVGNQIINSYFNEDGYSYEFKSDNKYGLPAGWYSFDRPIDQRPTKVIYFGAGKIMISNSKKSDGSWDWSTFGTGDGFTADKIITGILQGGDVHWNLDDGTFLIGKDVNNYKFYWDGSTLHMKDVDIDLTNNSTVKGISENVDKNNADIKKANDAITQTQTSVQVLKDSISSKVSKTEILSDKEIQNALKGRDGTDGTNGSNGSNFTWNLIKKSRSDVRISDWDNSKLEILDENYQFPELNVKDAKKVKFSGGGSLKGFLSYRPNMDSDMIKGNKYTVSIYVENLSDTDLEIKFNGFGWQTHNLKPNEKRYVVCKGEYDGNANQVQFYTSPDKEIVFAFGLLKAENGYNDNPVWSPHISEINGKDGIDGKDGTFTGEIGGRNLIKNSDDLSNCFVKHDGGNHTITDAEIPEFGISGKKVQALVGNKTDATKDIMLLDTENLIDGKVYTFSMYIKNTRDVPMKFNIKAIESGLVTIKPKEIKRIVVTGKKIVDENANGKFRVFFNSNTKDYYLDCIVSRPQLEEGDVATSWSKNPSDFISENQIIKRTFEAYQEQTDRRLLSTVSQTDFNKNNVAIQKQFSSVDQKANGIISTVSSKYKDLSKKIDGKPSATTVQSLISQKVDSVKIEVSNQITGVNSSISVMEKEIKLKADKTDLYGLVSFKDLQNKNSYTVINGENIKTGKISSADGSSWIDLKNGNFSFYHNSLFVDENQYDWNSKTKRTRLHTKGTFRVSYDGNPSVELNSGGITLFKDKAGQDSKGTNKIQSNGNGNVQISSIDGNGNINANVEIGSKNGYIMHIYGSLYVGRNLMVKQAIRYGISCQKGTSF